MSGEEFLSGLFEFIATWGPLGIGIAVVFFLIVFALVIGVFVFVFRQMRSMNRDFEDHRRRIR